MEDGAQKQVVQNKKKMERRVLGNSLRFVQRVQLAADAKQAVRVNGRRRRDEAVAKDENYEGFDEENQIKRKTGR